ncbi:hypothetical protein L6452_22347 [Arctium lappa]|uniref:Uncharacterized protein n=1 Tax=Arctium lappa TaxID=4217 RepID=A0ACB9B073_ARCLA|nr:hypothetical protein L6452_22347 [Arctium lappa]
MGRLWALALDALWEIVWTWEQMVLDMNVQGGQKKLSFSECLELKIYTLPLKVSLRRLPHLYPSTCDSSALDKVINSLENRPEVEIVVDDLSCSVIRVESSVNEDTEDLMIDRDVFRNRFREPEPFSNLAFYLVQS